MYLFPAILNSIKIPKPVATAAFRVSIMLKQQSFVVKHSETLVCSRMPFGFCKNIEIGEVMCLATMYMSLFLSFYFLFYFIAPSPSFLPYKLSDKSPRPHCEPGLAKSFFLLPWSLILPLVVVILGS